MNTNDTLTFEDLPKETQEWADRQLTVLRDDLETNHTTESIRATVLAQAMKMVATTGDPPTKYNTMQLMRNADHALYSLGNQGYSYNELCREPIRRGYKKHVIYGSGYIDGSDFPSVPTTSGHSPLDMLD